MDRAQKEQEDEYSFPYHYIPEFSNSDFSQTKYWSWGLRYFGGLKIVEHLIRERVPKPESILDVGCGDGRFLSFAKEIFPNARLLGIDYSTRSIDFARAFNPSIEYMCTDIVNDDIEIEPFEVVTLIEVIEHIPPRDLDEFLRSVISCMKPNGTMIITVPHVNKPVIPKHYQHFSATTLEATLSSHFQNIDLIPFDRRSRALNGALRLLGGDGRNFVITNGAGNRALRGWYEKKHLYAPNEDECYRLAAACSVPSH